MIRTSFQLSAWGPRQTWIAAIPTPENVRHILKTNFTNYNIPQQRKVNFRELFGRGIFASDGPSWHRQRKSASHLFTGRDMKSVITDVFLEHGRELLEHLLRQQSQGGKDESLAAAVDLHDLFFRFTMDCFSEIAFSHPGHGLRLAREGKSDPFGASFDRAQSLMTDRYFNPLWQVQRTLSRVPVLSQILRSTPFVGQELEIRAEVERMNHFVYEVIQERMQQDLKNQKQEKKGKGKGMRSGRKDLVDHFLRLLREDPELQKMEDAEKREELRDMVVNFIVAGRDTTACALSWFFYELSRHPEIEAELLQELTEVTGIAVAGGESATEFFGRDYRHRQHPKDTELGVVTLDYHIASKLNFLEAVLRETLRLHPSVPYDAKQALQNDVLPDGTPVPAGCVVTYSPYIAGRLTETWGDDALEFRPQRWLRPQPDDEGKDGKTPTDDRQQQQPQGKRKSKYPLLLHNAYKYPTFNAGPRVCLGQSLALLESKMLVGMLLQRLSFRLHPEAKVHYRTTVTLQMVNGLPVTLPAEHLRWSPHIPRPHSAHEGGETEPLIDAPPKREAADDGGRDDSAESPESPIAAAIRREKQVHDQLDGLLGDFDHLLVAEN